MIINELVRCHYKRTKVSPLRNMVMGRKFMLNSLGFKPQAIEHELLIINELQRRILNITINSPLGEYDDL